MSSSKKHKLIKTLLISNIAGCGCGKPKLSDVHEPTPKPKTQIPQNPTPQRRSSSSSCDKNGSFTVDEDDDNEDQCTSTTISFNNNSSSHPSDSSESTNPKNTKFPSPKWTKIEDSIAVVKESNDPYQDFRQSMLQMIVEKQIYSKEDLQELLSCFLELNSASHHDVIIQVFTQIWNDLIRESKKPIMWIPAVTCVMAMWGIESTGKWERLGKFISHKFMGLVLKIKAHAGRYCVFPFGLVCTVGEKFTCNGMWLWWYYHVF